jgi:hypothetical protein
MFCRDVHFALSPPTQDKENDRLNGYIAEIGSCGIAE